MSHKCVCSNKFSWVGLNEVRFKFNLVERILYEKDTHLAQGNPVVSRKIISYK